MKETTKNNPSPESVLAGDLVKGWDSTDRLSDRIDSYDTLKERTMEFVDWATDGGVPMVTKETAKIFRNLNTCGSYLIFRNYTRSNISRLIGACSCKQHLLCAFCAARRGVKNSVAYKEKIDILRQEKPHLRLLLVTFTVKNGPDLWERFSHLRSSMQAFLRRRNDSQRRDTPSSFKSVDGGVFAYEFKRGMGSIEWHPHIHMLALVDSRVFINHNHVKDEWLSITGDSSVVNLEQVISDNAFLEVFAYALKFSELEHSDRWQGFNDLRGEKLISSFGSLRGVDVPELETDELLDSEEPWVDMIYRFFRFRGYDNGSVMGRSDDRSAA